MNFEIFSKAGLGNVRTCYRTADGTPWFVARDVCECLGIKNSRDALKRLVSDEKMTVGLTDSHSGKRGGAQSITIVSESGLYTLIMGSRKKEAVDFQRWVTREVLPSIRKHGGYVLGQENLPKEEYETLTREVKRLAKRVKAYTEDSNYWFDMYTKLLDEYLHYTQKPDDALTLHDSAENEFVVPEPAGVWVDRNMFLTEIPEGGRYAIREREER